MSEDVVPCSGCGAGIVWRYTPRGARMPLDSKPLEGYAPGAYVMEGVRGCKPAEPMFDTGKAMFMNHWATCPKAHMFKKGNRG